MTGTGASIVTYHSDDRQLRRAIDALRSQSPFLLGTRIHMNESTDDEAERVRRLAQESAGRMPISVTWSSENRGFAGAHNELLKAWFSAGATHVAVINPDLTCGQACLATLVAHVDSSPVTALVGPLLLLSSPETGQPEGTIDSAGIVWSRDGRHRDRLQGKPIEHAPAKAHAVAGLSGACLLVTREAYLRVVDLTGEFFDPMFIAYREDAELAVRAALCGVTSLLVPEAVAHHARRLRGTSRGLSPHIDRLGVRNRLLMATKLGRFRPGNRVLSKVRDIIVVVVALTVERESRGAIADAFRLRPDMRRKNANLRRLSPDG